MHNSPLSLIIAAVKTGGFLFPDAVATEQLLQHRPRVSVVVYIVLHDN